MVAPRNLRFRPGFRSIIVIVAGSIGAFPLKAEPVSDQIFAGVSATEKNNCAIVRIDFHSRIQYLNHFPQTATDELRIQINPIERVAGDNRPKGARESVRAPASELASIYAIELEAGAPSSTLIVHFKRNVMAKVAQGPDFKSVLIAIPGPKGGTGCEPAADAGGPLAAVPPARANAGTTAKESLSGDQLQQVLVQARAELEKNNADRAVQLATRVVEAGETKYRQDALELLGNAREKRGQMAHARAEYQDYLRAYPQGPGAQRIRERLAVIEGTLAPASGGAAGGIAETGKPAAKVALDSKSAGKPLVGDGGSGTHLPLAPTPPAEWTVSQFGSLSAFYNLNQGGRGFIEAPRTNIGWDKENPYKTYQNSVLGNFDYDARFDNQAFAGRFRFSASQQHDFLYGTTEETRISALYLDGKLKDAGSTFRIGRQTSTSGGVLGRYDGAAVGYKYNQTVNLNAVAGGIVEKSSDLPFASDSYFYGAGADIAWPGKNFDTTGYIIEQRKSGRVDRQAIGVEGRYFKDGLASYASAEYDVHFGELNSAVLSASRYFADQSSASVNIDWRRAPILLVSNALQGQGVYKLTELLQRYSSAQIDQLSLDRTAESFTATLAVSRPLNSWLQWNGDVTVNRVGGMPASGGVEAMSSSGADTYLSTQLIGQGIIRDGDMVSGGLRFADAANSDRYLAEFAFAYPITPEWRVNPMLRLGYVDYKHETRQEYQFLPTVRTSYQIMRDTMLEFEVGGKFVQSNSDISKAYETELLLLAGIRHDFSNAK